jgi:ElaB/YqjD/DUF883 family membrane-anchored ribosome-binding protein
VQRDDQASDAADGAAVPVRLKWPRNISRGVAMEASHDGSQSDVRGAADRVANDFRNGVKNVRAVGAAELQKLIADVEELLSQVANLKDAETVRIRGRVERALENAKLNLEDTTATVKTQARRVASSADDYVRESPWQALGVAVLVGVAIGLLASRRQ